MLNLRFSLNTDLFQIKECSTLTKFDIIMSGNLIFLISKGANELSLQ